MARQFFGVVLALSLVTFVGGCASSTGGQERTAEQQEKALSARIAVGIESIRMGDPERARRHLSKALEIAPKSGEAHNAMALLYAYERDDEREEEHYRKALRYNPGFSQGRNNYAVLLFRQGRYNEAIKQLEKATADTSYDQRSIAFLNLGRSYAKTGDLEGAAGALDRSLRLDSNQVDVFLELADVAFQRGQLPESQRYLELFGARAKQTPRSLWLGIRLGQALGNTELVGGYEMQLDSLFKGTPEHTQWLAWREAGRPVGRGQGQ